MEKINRIRTKIDSLKKELEPLWEEERDLCEALFEVRKKSQPIKDEIDDLQQKICRVENALRDIEEVEEEQTDPQDAA